MKTKIVIYMILVWVLVTIINIITYSDSKTSLYIIYKEEPVENVLLYYDTGKGFNEEEKIGAYKTDENIYVFDFDSNIKLMQQIRLDLSYHESQTVIEGMEWRRDGKVVREVSYDMLCNYVTNQEQFKLEKDGDRIVASNDNGYISIIFGTEFIKFGVASLDIKLWKVIGSEILFIVVICSIMCIIYMMGLSLQIKEKRMAAFYLLIMNIFVGGFLLRNEINIKSLFQMKTQSDAAAFLLTCFLAVLMAVLYYALLGLGEHSCVLDKRKRVISMQQVYESTIFVLLWWGLYEVVLCNLVNEYDIGETVSFLINYVMMPKYLLNVILLFLLYGFFKGIAGRGLGNILFGLLNVILIVGNAIKIKFHQTLLTPMDFLQIKDMLRISTAFVNIKQVLAGTGIILLIGAALIIKFRKQVWNYLKPNISFQKTLACGIPLLCFTYLLATEKLIGMGLYYMAYANEFINEEQNGVYVYNLNNILHLKDVYVSKPKNYTEKIQKLREEFQNTAIKEDEIDDDKPNVIVVMAESLFDIERLDSVTFSEEVEPTIHNYQTSDLISPRYGGYTAAVEFEALTGMSLAFFPEGLMPYTTYFHNPKEQMPSIVWEFRKNDYETIAIHPNLKEFYNRDVAYEQLGFEQFQTIEDFTINNESTTMAGYVRDSQIAERIINQLESAEMPTFTFVVTIEAHYMNSQKYAEHSISAKSSLLSEEELWELEEMAESYRNTDEMIKTLIDYIDQTDKNTILYVFGDHLPPLPAFEKLEYTEELYNKYTTTLLAYSNYKDIDFGAEYITPNQLAAQIVLDANIEHSSYFDYIASFRNEYPVLQKQFVNVERSEFDTYRLLQYDIMFGKRYLVDWE